jgi:hypothetical protein
MENHNKPWIAIQKSKPDHKEYLTEDEKVRLENHPSFIKGGRSGGGHLYRFVKNPDYTPKAPAPVEAKKADKK